MSYAFRYSGLCFHCIVSYVLYSDLPGVYIMGYIPYVGFATHRRATVRTRFTFCIKKKKKKKKKGDDTPSYP